MAQVKKLSVATVYGKIKLSELMDAKNKDGFPVMRVYGSAVSIKKGMSSFGEWEALQGRFKAINPATGEASEAATLFLPTVALLPIQVALNVPDARGVEFAIDVRVKFSEESQTKYEYSWEPLLLPSEDDPILRLEKKMLALAGPKAPAETPKESEPAPAPAPAPAPKTTKGK